MKKTLKILLATMLCAAVFVTFAGAALTDFADAPAEDSWKHAGLASAVENGIMKGANGKLNPDAPLTRAELTAMMVRVLGAHEDKAEIDHFVDVALDAWYADYIKSGVAVKIINGAGNKMMPNDPITREQAFAILARTFVLAADSHSAVENFDDVHHVSDWAKDATAALIENEIVQGGSANDIRPKANVTRAEYAAMLDRLVGAYAKPGESYAGKTIKGSIVITSADVDLSGAIIEGKVIITDAVRDGEVKLDGVKAEDLVMRSGTAVVSGASEIKNVVYGNPIHKAEVKADEEVVVEKVVVTENAADVNNEVSAEKVEIQASDATVELGGNTEYKEVEIKADNAKVEVKEDVKVENATVEGANSAVTGSGKVENATVSEGSKVETSGTNVTVKPSEPVTPDTPDTPDTPVKPSEPSKPSDSPNSSTIPSGAVTELEVKNAYILTSAGAKIPDTDAREGVIEFDFTAEKDETVLDKIFVSTNKNSARITHDMLGIDFEADYINGVEIAEIIRGIIGEEEGSEESYDVLFGMKDTNINTLNKVVSSAESHFSDQETDAALLDLFGITFESEGEGVIKVGFDVEVSGEAYKLVILVNRVAFEE